MDTKTKMQFNVLAIICIIVFSISLAPKTLQNDTYYTISVGEHIAESGIDGQDPFAWTELKYTYPHWLYDLGIYEIYNNWGMDGIYISTIILSCLLGLAIYITNTKINKNQLFSFVLTLGVMYLMKDFIAARAQLVTFILFILEILCIEGFLEGKKRYAVRFSNNRRINCQSTCRSILCIFHTNVTILCRIFNNTNKRSTPNV